MSTNYSASSPRDSNWSNMTKARIPRKKLVAKWVVKQATQGHKNAEAKPNVVVDHKAKEQSGGQELAQFPVGGDPTQQQLALGLRTPTTAQEMATQGQQLVPGLATPTATQGQPLKIWEIIEMRAPDSTVKIGRLVQGNVQSVAYFYISLFPADKLTSDFFAWLKVASLDTAALLPTTCSISFVFYAQESQRLTNPLAQEDSSSPPLL
jgi:hypothetical protein